MERGRKRGGRVKALDLAHGVRGDHSRVCGVQPGEEESISTYQTRTKSRGKARGTGSVCCEVCKACCGCCQLITKCCSFLVETWDRFHK